MSKWLPGAKVILAPQDGGSMVGGNPKVVWHTTEADPATTTATDMANYLNREGYQVHLVWHPVSGEIVQMIPSDRAGRGLEHPLGTPETNRQGSICIQIEVVGQAVHPFTDGPCNGLDRILKWLRKLGIKDRFPAGNPLSYPASYGTNGHRDESVWLQNGHFGHENVPNNVHGDPGEIDPAKILAAGKPQKPSKPGKVLVSDPKIGRLQKAIHHTTTNKWGPSTDKALEAVRKGYSKGVDIAYLQKRVGVTPDEVWGPKSRAAYKATVKAVQVVLGVAADGKWDEKTDQAYNAEKKSFNNVYVNKHN